MFAFPRLPRAYSLVIAIGCLLAAAHGVHAQSKSNPVAAGGRLAADLCSQCHVVAANGRTGWTNAPAFETIGNRPGETAAKLSAFIQQPQPQMLHTNQPKGDADAIAAYIMSLRRH